MGCYCGCGTKGNKIRWTLGILFMVLGVGFLVAMIVSAISAYNDYVDCLEELQKEGKITSRQKKDAENNNAFSDESNVYINECMEDHLRSGPAGAFFWLMVAFFVAGSIQFYIMCCCAKTPEQLQGGQQVYVAQPYAQQPQGGQQVYVAQPYGQQPTYYASNIQMTKV
eukprot:TRINITY_DN21973_c1_g1_i1.p4 TRINITY_DN21973_c1_g1~~TRINITY_DN21973_c1_g1_i1.p4  ORF type:complete len:168 (-),score=26.08 TRINITY_DN21973_c1_g1_i1:1466-1969(-)